MAVKVSRMAQFSSGSRGYRFESHRDEAEDRKVYEVGKTLEREVSREGSLGQRVLERLFFAEANASGTDRD
jgi:hypothetical protein